MATVVAALVAVASGLAACGRSSPSPAKAASRRARDNEQLVDASARAETKTKAAVSATTTTFHVLTAAEKDRLLRCGVPPNTGTNGFPTVPGREENPFGKPESDFPLKVVVKPTKFDRGTKVDIDTVVVSPDKVVVVVLASFFDNTNHGVKAAKFADKSGKASFEFTIPDDAPLGLGRFVVSASTKDNKSAIEDPKFIVTGPGCE